MKIKQIFFILIPSLALIGGIFGYSAVFGSNTNFKEPSMDFYIRTGSNFTDLLHTLLEENIIDDSSSFQFTCKLKKFGEFIKPGRYVISKGMSNNELVRMFRSGNQTPFLVPVENTSTLEELAGVLSKNLEPDSETFASVFQDPNVANRFGFTTETFPSMMIANRYELFWTITPDKFLEKMNVISQSFWNNERKKKASGIGLSIEEVYTLASIVKSETGKIDEAPEIAGLYMNRLSKGMKLQSDPTALFAGRKKDVRRVLSGDLRVDSPYNTYHYAGLPPGPICIVEAEYLDAVLDYTKHDYIYMCAKPDFSGFHNFSKTLDQHEIYRSQYRKALDKRNIRR